MIHDCIAEDFDNVVHHKDRIQEELIDMRKLLKQIGEAQITGNMVTRPSTSQTRKIGRRRLGYNSYNTTSKRNIPHQTQYVVHGQDHGANTPKRLKPNPIGITMDTIQGSTQIAGEHYPRGIVSSAQRFS
jgi:hypothetical protein